MYVFSLFESPPPLGSKKEMTSSLLPTAIVFASGDHDMFMFSPSVSMVAVGDLGAIIYE